METGLAIHGQLAPAEVQPLHQRLLERLGQLKQSLKKPAIPSLLDSIQKCVYDFLCRITGMLALHYIESFKLKYFCDLSSTLPSIPISDQGEPDPYTNTVGYGRLCKPEEKDDLYSRASVSKILSINYE